jgi:cell shape-determining protein MreC
MDTLPDEVVTLFIDDVLSLVNNRFHLLREKTTSNSKFIKNFDDTRHKNVLLLKFKFINFKKKIQNY